MITEPITNKPTIWAEVDANGRLIIPPDLASRYGLQPGERVRLQPGENDLRLHRAVGNLAKIYIEPTNRCNLDCLTCMRHNWDVTMGRMSAAVFERILAGIREIDPPPTVFFGGVGEPLFHPRTPEMVAAVKAADARAELITNGTLLDEKKARALIEAGLDLIWVSLDGARPESYADVRLGAELPNVLANIRRLRSLRRPGHRAKPAIGIAFVAMRRNIGDLPELLNLGKRLGVSRFHVSNVQPHTRQMQQEILYTAALNSITFVESPWLRQLILPKMDLNEHTREPFLQALDSGYNVRLAGQNLGGANDVCTFIESGSLTVGWDGRVTPCPPLLYDHTVYLREYERKSRQHTIGNVLEHGLLDLWHDPDYVAYRERVQSFAFAPCTPCGGCELLEENQTDCFDNQAPACGACLWAQGIVQCP